MDKRLIIIILVHLFFTQCSVAQFHASEKRVKKSKISKQIIDYVETNHEGSSVKYYRLKTDTDSIYYEAKVKSKEGKVTLIFNQKNQLINTHKEVHYLNVSEELRAVIDGNISQILPTHKITDCRNQKHEGHEIYELDVSAKKKKYRFWFNTDGSLVEYKEVPQKTIDLIFN